MAPAPKDRAHPGHGMSFGKGEWAAQPALPPVPGQLLQLPASNLPALCSQPCPGATALRDAQLFCKERQKRAEGQGPALLVPRSILCPSTTLYRVVPGAQ